MIEAVVVVLTGFCIFGVLYIKYLIKQIKNISRDFLVVKEMLSNYEESLKRVYETEMFYGEPVLQALVEQTRDLAEDLKGIVLEYDYEDLEREIDDMDQETIDEEA